MRRVFLASVTLAIACLPLLSGCGTLRPNEGRFAATLWAAYAGRFRIAYGHWPTIEELEEFSCMRGRADRFGLELASCDVVVNAPYRPRMTPRGANLDMRFVGVDDKEVCHLKVIAPLAGADKAVFPMIVIKTSVFKCPGGNRAWTNVDAG